MYQKIIHIEKYDFVAFEKEKKHYTMILNELMQKFPMEHAKELLLWIFLQSMPPNWIPNKQHIMKHFFISSRTYERYMSYLNAIKLIEYRQKRTASGAFGAWTLVVLNGSKYDPNGAANRSATIGGTVVNRVKKTKVIHRAEAANNTESQPISEIVAAAKPLKNVASTRDSADTQPKKQKVIHNLERNRCANNGGVVKPFRTRASTSDSAGSPFRHLAVERWNDAHINTTIKNINTKKNNNACAPVSVFSQSCFVKDYLTRVIAKRDVFVDDDVVEQIIFYSFHKNQDHSFDSVNKRINIALKKVRDGAWLIPQGFQGITSQSIRENEEEALEEKQKTWALDAAAFNAIFNNEKISHEPAKPKKLSEMLKEYRETMENAKKTYSSGVPEKTF